MYKIRVVKNDGTVALEDVFCTLCNEVVEKRSQTRHDRYCSVALWLELAPVGQESSVLLRPDKVAAHESRCPATNRV